MSGGEEGQDEYVSIPKHVSAVARPAQAAPLTAASPVSATDPIRWKRDSRIANCNSSSPSMTTSASSHRPAHA